MTPAPITTVFESFIVGFISGVMVVVFASIIGIAVLIKNQEAERDRSKTPSLRDDQTKCEET